MTRIPQEMREAVRRRAGNRYEYCQLPQEVQVATFPVDHVRPMLLAGPTELDNLALACPSCNAAKWTYVSAVDPETGKDEPIFNPRQQIWSEHFCWSSSDPTVIEAISATGRATMSLLDLDSSNRRNIRRWLMAVNMHPPGG